MIVKQIRFIGVLLLLASCQASAATGSNALNQAISITCSAYPAAITVRLQRRGQTSGSFTGFLQDNYLRVQFDKCIEKAGELTCKGRAPYSRVEIHISTSEDGRYLGKLSRASGDAKTVSCLPTRTEVFHYMEPK